MIQNIEADIDTEKEAEEKEEHQETQKDQGSGQFQWAIDLIEENLPEGEDKQTLALRKIWHRSPSCGIEEYTILVQFNQQFYYFFIFKDKESVATYLGQREAEIEEKEIANLQVPDPAHKHSIMDAEVIEAIA